MSSPSTMLGHPRQQRDVLEVGVCQKVTGSKRVPAMTARSTQDLLSPGGLCVLSDGRSLTRGTALVPRCHGHCRTGAQNARGSWPIARLQRQKRDGTFSKKPTKPGNYTISCELHPVGMIGRVVVRK